MGSLLHFRAENAPAGAPMRCTDGCPVSDDCPYNAQRFYLGDNTDWPVSVISADHSLAARRRALETGPYGRCVYHCDNNVVDHQVVALEFEGGKTATHTMTAFTPDFSRSIEIMGTRGYLTGQMCKYDDPTRRNKIWITDFRANQVTCIEADDHGLVTGHEGADFRLAMDFVRQVQAHEHGGRTSAARSVESHLMSLAAEKSRLENRQVSMSEMWAMG